jgi:hypothetical protein
VPELRLDREVLELLRDDPELLAIADAIAATQRRRDERTPAGASPNSSAHRRVRRLGESRAGG